MTNSEIIELESKIISLRKAYWEGNCTTPDSEYDALVEKLRSVEPENSLLTSPEHGATSSKSKVSHKVPMLSLQKVYNKEDLMKWIESVSRSDDEEFLVQPKYDGISCHYDHGTWSTRGDGNVGEDISNVCQRMCTPERKDDSNTVSLFDEFYGEIVIKKSDFDTIYKNVKRDNGETFKNTRNAVAGILNADDYSFYANQGAKLTLVEYDKYSFSMKKSEADTKWDIIKAVINGLDYPMDGIVVKIADRNWYNAQGFTSHHPKGAMAFKFENASAKTFLKGIDWGMGKEYITATAVFQPVNLGGVTVSRAYIPMKSKTLPCVMNGDYNYDAVIIVERAGDVIPHITDIMKSPFGDEFMIDKCPFCGSEIEILESGVRCKNPNCLQKKIHRLYESLVQLGIKNIGETTVSDIVRQLGGDKAGNLLYWWIDVIPRSRYFISNIEGYGDKSAQLIVDETQRICDTTIPKFIAAMGIPNVGLKIGREIERRFDSISKFIDSCTKGDLLAMDGVGEVMADRIMEWLGNDANVTDMFAIAQKMSFKNVNQTAEDTAGNASQQSVCFTGAMRMKRSEMQYIARQHGYIPMDSVTRGLDILVVADDVDLTSSKCVKAQKYGTKIIREAEFLKKCNSALEIQQQ